MTEEPEGSPGMRQDGCDAITGFGREGDEFVRLSREEVEAINRDPGSPFKVPPAAVEAYVNRNPDSPRRAYWIFESGNVGRAFTQRYTDCRSERKHDGVRELLGSYRELLEKYEGCMSQQGSGGEVCGIIYIVARTGQRVGARDETTVEQYRYSKDRNGRPKRVVTGHVRTYGISTLRSRHVIVDGDRVSISFTGKSGQPQNHVIVNPVVADLFRRLLKDKGPDDPVFTPHIYRSVYVKFKSDTGHAIKDLRTAMAHLIVPEAKKEWMEEHGRPVTKAQEKKMIRYAVNKAAAILGNKPGVVKKSYANPDDLMPEL